MKALKHLRFKSWMAVIVALILAFVLFPERVAGTLAHLSAGTTSSIGPLHFSQLSSESAAIIVLMTMGILALGFALYLGLMDRVRTGSNEGLWYAVRAIAIVPALLAWLMIAGVRTMYPYSDVSTPFQVLYVVLALVLSAIFYGFVLAHLSLLITSASTVPRPPRAYTRHFWQFIGLVFYSWIAYGLLVMPFADDLNRLVIWVGVLAGWMIAPALISRGYTDS